MKVKDPELKKLSQQKSLLQNKTSVKVEKLNAKQLSRHFALNSMNIKLHIGILGPKKCGKTSLLKAFIYKTFNPSLKEDTILNIHKLIISAEYKPIEVIITEINIRSNTTNEKIAKELINSMDAIFLCHEMSEKDISFNEEDNNKTISYINNITNKKNINDKKYIHIDSIEINNIIKSKEKEDGKENVNIDSNNGSNKFQNVNVTNEELMKKIKNSIDDNLKVMLNFSYENFLSKESERE